MTTSNQTQTEKTARPQRNAIEITRAYYPILGYDLKVIDENGARKLTLGPVTFPKAIEAIVAIPQTIYRMNSIIDIRTTDVIEGEEDAFLAVIRKLESMTNESAIYKQQRDRAESF